MADTKWRLVGYDAFSDTEYPIEGSFSSEEEALEAAKRHFEDIEKWQPTDDSGGQDDDGIQDRISIVRPDGTRFRFPANVLSPQEREQIF